LRSVSAQASSILVLALAAAGCGGAGTSARPLLPHGLGHRLAVQAGQVERELAAGDAAAARADAASLRHAAVAAVRAGDVPAPLREPLLDAVRRLVSLTATAMPATTTTSPTTTEPSGGGEKKHGDEGKHKGKGHGKEKHD
jgi:hypothetical protein